MGYQQPQPGVAIPGSTSERWQPDLNMLDPALSSIATLKVSHLPINWDLTTFVTKFLQKEDILEKFVPIHHQCGKEQLTPKVYLYPQACSAGDCHRKKLPRSHDMALAYAQAQNHSRLWWPWLGLLHQHWELVNPCGHFPWGLYSFQLCLQYMNSL